MAEVTSSSLVGSTFVSRLSMQETGIEWNGQMHVLTLLTVTPGKVDLAPHTETVSCPPGSVRAADCSAVSWSQAVGVPRCG
jgi:hypothetical protein